jgi:AraC family ethanolamine operon transcriptional activator
MNTIDTPEFEDFQSALRGVRLRYVLRARPERNWRLTRTELDGLGLMKGQEGAASICTGVASAGYFNALIPLGHGEPLVVDGHHLEPGQIAWMAPDCSFNLVSSEPASWIRITMPKESVRSWFACNADVADPALLTRNCAGLSNGSTAELVRLASGFLEIDGEDKQEIRGAAKECEARHELLGATLRAVLPAAGPIQSRRHVPHAAHILDRALAFIAGRTGNPVRIEDLCRVTGVSERTLRNLFYRNFGMGPHQYLTVTRLHDVRAAIRESGPGAQVSSICADFGIWDFGRFAGQYRRLFGNLPSQELTSRRLGATHAGLLREATRRSSVSRGYSPNILR